MLIDKKAIPSTNIRLSTFSEKMILRILYFEIFSYPLTLKEIIGYLSISPGQVDQLKGELSKLCSGGLLYFIDGHYTTKNRPDWIRLRKEANKRAQQCTRKARRRALFISRFPFVRAVFFSGTFAKGLMYADSDVDFFIVTKPERLWVSRTLLVLYKKLFLLNSRKYFCVNYFVDEEHLSISEKNLFTATEIATLKPAVGDRQYENFCNANRWVKSFYKNFKSKDGTIGTVDKSVIKDRIESLLGGDVGEKLDDLCYRFTLRFWRKKFSWMSDETFQLALKSKKYLSKHHPSNYQIRVLRKYNYAIEEFEKLHDVKLRRLTLVD